MIRLATLAALVVAGAPATALAANAQHPYSNVDHRVDAGNDTGDSQVEALNQRQLNRAAGRPGVAAVPYGYGAPAYARPPAYVYAPPPVAYAPYYPAYGYRYRYYYPY